MRPLILLTFRSSDDLGITIVLPVVLYKLNQQLFLSADEGGEDLGITRVLLVGLVLIN